ncbi:MAG: DUF2202 domain-containing protein [Bacteroidota bacterium]|jgi:hypothetical protein|nr:DUF2202 domain-containing protein [Bacteroidota bacterium]
MIHLDEAELIGLQQALDDEYKSWTTYDWVIKNFGEVRPFINIREAETRHIEALLNLFQQYNVTPTANKWIGLTPKFTSVKNACAAAVVGELENVALYNTLLKSTTKQDILNVYHALRTASQERHLPAFQRCANKNN